MRCTKETDHQLTLLPPPDALLPQLPLALRRLLSPPGSRPVRVSVRAVIPCPAKTARRVLLDWEAPWLALADAPIIVRGVDYGNNAAVPLRPGAMREMVRAIADADSSSHLALLPVLLWQVVTKGPARGATLLQRLDGVSRYHMTWHSTPRVAEERAISAGAHALVTTIEADADAAAAATAQFAAAVKRAEAESEAAAALVSAFLLCNDSALRLAVTAA